MQPFLTYCEEIDGLTRYFILQKKFPHYKGEVLRREVYDRLTICKVPEYDFWVGFSGTLAGNFVPAVRTTANELNEVFNEMAIWYYNEVISKKESNYKRYKTKYD